MEEKDRKRTGPLVEIINDRQKKPQDEISREVLPGDIFRTPVEILRQPRRNIRDKAGTSDAEANPWNPWKDGN